VTPCEIIFLFPAMFSQCPAAIFAPVTMDGSIGAALHGKYLLVTRNRWQQVSVTTAEYINCRVFRQLASKP
jgi:hypothetical protein